MAERKRSNVWMHFSMSTSSNEVAKCDICKREYSIRGGTSNLSKHLRVKHIIDDLHTPAKRQSGYIHSVSFSPSLSYIHAYMYIKLLVVTDDYYMA